MPLTLALVFPQSLGDGGAMFLDDDISKGPKSLRKAALGCKTDTRLLKRLCLKGAFAIISFFLKRKY